MKRLKYVLIIFTLLINGCFLKEKDITKMIFPTAMMISNENDLFQIYLLSVSTTTNSKIELETSTNISKYSLSKYEDKTINSAINKAGIATNGTTSAMKIETVILHDSLFQNPDLTYDTICLQIANNPLFRTNSYIYHSNKDPHELLNVNSLEVSDSYYYYIIRPEKENLEDYILPSRLVDTLKAYKDNKRMFYLPSLSLKEDSVELEKDGEFIKVNTFYVNGAYFLNKKGKFSFINIDKLNGYKWADKKEYFDIDIGNLNTPTFLKIEKVKWKTSIKDNIPSLDIKMKVKINYNHSDLNPKEVEELLKETIKKDVYYTYTSLYHDIDIYLFDDLSYRLNKSINNSTFNLNIELIIKNTIYKY